MYNIWRIDGFPSLTGVIRFLIDAEIRQRGTILLPVSVPYRGYSFFNLNRIVYMDNAIIVSVPYRGYSFFNFPRLQTIYDAPDSKVSVPYRGYSFFNTPTKTSQTKQKQSVSVLTGVIRFLICFWCRCTVCFCFRPLQGLFVF